jgi:hypothetical protein
MGNMSPTVGMGMSDARMKRRPGIPATIRRIAVHD